MTGWKQTKGRKTIPSSRLDRMRYSSVRSVLERDPARHCRGASLEFDYSKYIFHNKHNRTAARAGLANFTSLPRIPVSKRLILAELTGFEYV
jgi:hypothetical protein